MLIGRRVEGEGAHVAIKYQRILLVYPSSYVNILTTGTVLQGGRRYKQMSLVFKRLYTVYKQRFLSIRPILGHSRIRTKILLSCFLTHFSKMICFLSQNLNRWDGVQDKDGKPNP